MEQQIKYSPERGYAPATTEALSEMLGVLRSHGVESFENDAHGMRIRFHRPAPSQPMPMRLTPADFDIDDEPEPVKTEAPLPPEGAIHPEPLNLEDALFGAK